MKNVWKVVRDCDRFDIPFYIRDFGDLSVKLYVDQTYSIFYDDDNVPLTGGLRPHVPITIFSDLST